MSLFARLYRGDIDFDFPKFYRRTLMVSGVLLVVSIGAFFLNGLNLSIDFDGGTVWSVPSKTMNTDDANAVLAEFDASNGSKVQEVTAFVVSLRGQEIAGRPAQGVSEQGEPAPVQK